MNVEYAKAVYGKLGEGIAEVLYISFGDDIYKVDIIETKRGPIQRTTTTVGLKIAHKVIAVCGDNASNNDTFCDHFLRILHENDYDEDPQLSLGLKRCLFRGRKSRIRCLAHIYSLICDIIFDYLYSSTREEAAKVIKEALDSRS